jgi:hypothetical protein
MSGPRTKHGKTMSNTPAWAPKRIHLVERKSGGAGGEVVTHLPQIPIFLVNDSPVESARELKRERPKTAHKQVTFLCGLLADVDYSVFHFTNMKGDFVRISEWPMIDLCTFWLIWDVARELANVQLDHPMHDPLIRWYAESVIELKLNERLPRMGLVDRKAVIQKARAQCLL